ncbi:MAG: hypothetical protein HZA01_16460 [Nitrospinae bacterium]|nr:hypothetical protein [Nitrospinota bacterium]
MQKSTNEAFHYFSWQPRELQKRGRGEANAKKRTARHEFMAIAVLVKFYIIQKNYFLAEEDAEAIRNTPPNSTTR